MDLREDAPVGRTSCRTATWAEWASPSVDRHRGTAQSSWIMGTFPVLYDSRYLVLIRGPVIPSPPRSRRLRRTGGGEIPPVERTEDSICVPEGAASHHRRSPVQRCRGTDPTDTGLPAERLPVPSRGFVGRVSLRSRNDHPTPRRGEIAPSTANFSETYLVKYMIIMNR